MHTSHMFAFWETQYFLANGISIVLIQGVNSDQTITPVGEEDGHIKGKSRKNDNARVDRSKRCEGLLIFISSDWFLKGKNTCQLLLSSVSCKCYFLFSFI